MTKPKADAAEAKPGARPSGRYRKIEVRTWGDEKFRALSPIPPCGQGLWLFLITGPHTGPIPGLFRAGRAAMAEELGWEIEDFDKAFGEAFQQGMVKADFKARVVWVPKAIRHNKPESPNVVRSWGTEFDLIPECDLKGEAFEALKASIHALGESFGKAFDETLGKASGKPSAKAMANQEQEQQQEQIGRPTVSSARPTIPCPYDEIVQLYHSKLPGLPRVKLMPDARQRAMRKLWGWVLSSCKANGDRRAVDAAGALAWLSDYFTRAAANDFLMGRGERTGAHANWRCDLDFLLTDKGMRHVIEKTEAAA